MIKTASRSLLRQSASSLHRPAQQRFLSTAPPSQKSRSWKSSAVRWSLAIGGIIYYNTSNVFAEQPFLSTATPHEAPEDETSLPTLESLSSSRRSKDSVTSASETLPAAASTLSSQDTSPTSTLDDPPRTPEEYEEEASQQGAFNEETGEINWDCPCLGGMAHGPCGEQFRAAFSCFVYSKEEPKGMDCIERFKNMQGCFREHPDVYGAELEDDENETPAGEDTPAAASISDVNSSAPIDIPPSSSTLSSSSSLSSSAATSAEPSSLPSNVSFEEDSATRRAKAATQQVAEDHGIQSESESLLPKAAHDATVSREGK